MDGKLTTTLGKIVYNFFLPGSGSFGESLLAILTASIQEFISSSDWAMNY